MDRVLEQLRAFGMKPRLHLPHRSDGGLPLWVSDVDLVLNRGLNQVALNALERLERQGLCCCNRVRSTIQAQRRGVLLRTLARSGLPVPAWTEALDWSRVVACSERAPIVVKAEEGRRGRGVGVAFLGDGEPSSDAPFPGPYIVQERVARRGWDRKVYVADGVCRGLLKRWPRPVMGSDRRFVPGKSLTSLARRVGRALDLDIYGVDFLVTDAGPVIVDVNVFPGFRGVADAHLLIARQLCRLGLSARR